MAKKQSERAKAAREAGAKLKAAVCPAHGAKVSASFQVFRCGCLKAL